jgi:hypothetical protein
MEPLFPSKIGDCAINLKNCHRSGGSLDSRNVVLPVMPAQHTEETGQFGLV